MMCSAAWRIDDAALVEMALSHQLREALPAAQREAAAMLAPALGSDFKRHVSPALVLVASAGMGREESRAWQSAAADTLRGIPADLLAMGAKVARETADHPSKIVPTILKAVKRYWDGRKADAARLETLAAIARGERRRLPWEQPAFDPATRCSPEEAALIAAEHGLDLSVDRAPAPTGPRRMPTEADYAEMGITSEMLAASRAAAAAERKEAQQRAKAPVDEPGMRTGPAVEIGGTCPFCGNDGVDEHKGVMLCGSPDCLAEWRPEPNFVIDEQRSAVA